MQVTATSGAPQDSLHQNRHSAQLEYVICWFLKERRSHLAEALAAHRSPLEPVGLAALLVDLAALAGTSRGHREQACTSSLLGNSYLLLAHWS
jgi:hypothetical protein